MNTKEAIKSDILKLMNNQTKLYSYLYDLIYNEVISDVGFLEDVYSSFLKDDRKEIQRIAIYSLLFGLKLQRDEYKDFALSHTKDIKCNYDLRSTCITGLSQAYQGSKTKEILSIFFQLHSDSNEDEGIRAECFVGMLKVLGLSSAEIVRKNGNKVIVTLDDVQINNFSSDFKLINQIIKK